MKKSTVEGGIPYHAEMFGGLFVHINRNETVTLTWGDDGEATISLEVARQLGTPTVQRWLGDRVRELGSA